MRITNQSGATIEWIAFNADDILRMAPLHRGFLDDRNYAQLSMGSDEVALVVLEVGPDEFHRGLLFTAERISNRGHAIVTPRGIVDRHSARVEKWLPADEPVDDLDTAVMHTEALAAQFALDGLVVGLAGMSPALAPVAGGIGLLGNLILTSFAGSSPPQHDLPSLSDIESTLKKVVDSQEAERRATDILTAWHWYNEECLAIADPLVELFRRDLFDEASADIRGYARDVFVSNIGGLLGPESELVQAIEHLTTHGDLRRRVLPAYVTGIGLLLSLRRLDLLLRKADGNLVTVGQVNSIRQHLHRFIEALERSREEYPEFREELVRETELEGTTFGDDVAKAVDRRYLQSEDGLGAFLDPKLARLQSVHESLDHLIRRAENGEDVDLLADFVLPITRTPSPRHPAWEFEVPAPLVSLVAERGCRFGRPFWGDGHWERAGLQRWRTEGLHAGVEERLLAQHDWGYSYTHGEHGSATLRLGYRGDTAVLSWDWRRRPSRRSLVDPASVEFLGSMMGELSLGIHGLLDDIRVSA